MSDTTKAEEIKEKLRGLVPTLRSQFNVESLALFGSYIRREQKAGSDLDILVTFRQTPTLIDFVRLENYLSDTLGLKVDLVMKDVLKPRIGRHILNEAIPI